MTVIHLIIFKRYIFVSVRFRFYIIFNQILRPGDAGSTTISFEVSTYKNNANPSDIYADINLILQIKRNMKILYKIIVLWIPMIR